jgi:hypothetical protein
VITASKARSVFEYLKSEFSLPESAIEEGYVNYQALKAITTAAPKFNPGRWYEVWPVDWTVAGKTGPWAVLKLHNGRFIFRPVGMKMTTSPPTTVIVPGGAGVVYHFAKSAPHKIYRMRSVDSLFLRPDPSIDTGVFVQQTGKVFIVEKKLPHGSWQACEASIPREALTQDPRDTRAWVSNGPLIPLTGGLFANSDAPEF